MGPIRSSVVCLATLGLILALGLTACTSIDSKGRGNPRSDSGTTPDAAVDRWTYVDPSKLGPYPAGNLTRLFVDDSRDEPLTPEASDKRTLVTEIWYPASAEARTAERDAFISFYGTQVDAGVTAFATALNLDAAGLATIEGQRTGSVRDAKIAEGGPFPVVLYSHGNGGGRATPFTHAEYLASHGYVVVSPDHTGNARLTVLPTGNVPYDVATTVDFATRVADMRFLIDEMARLEDSDPDGVFAGKLDLEHIAMTGYSLGGLTTLQVVPAEPRVDVGVPFAGVSVLAAGVTRPMMHFLATEDQTIGASGIKQIEDSYRASEGPRWILRLVDGGHRSFSSTGCLFTPNVGDGCGPGQRLADHSPFTFLDHARADAIVDFYQVALYGYYLKGVTAYADDLVTNPFDGDLQMDMDRVPTK